MKLDSLLEDTTTSATSGGSYSSVMSKEAPLRRLKGQFASYGLGEKACHGCGIIKTTYETLGSRRSPKLITCRMCGTNHKV